MNKKINEYFDLSIPNEKLYSAGEVEEGQHGVEIINGDYYASLYHIKNFISKGELKDFLSQFKTTESLFGFSEILAKKYKFDVTTVKYKTQDFKIKKYPYEVILNYFMENNKKIDVNLNKLFQELNTNGLYEIEGKSFRRFEELNNIQLSKINFFVGQNNAGKSTVTEMLRILISYLKQPDHSYIDLYGTNFGRLLNSKQKNKNKNEIELRGKFDNSTFRFIINGVLSKSKASISNLELDTPTINCEIFFYEEDVKVSLKTKDKEIQTDSRSRLEEINELEKTIKDLDKLLDDKTLPTTNRLKYSDQKNKLKERKEEIRTLYTKSMKMKRFETLFFETTKEKVQVTYPLSLVNILREVYKQNSKILKNTKETKTDEEFETDSEFEEEEVILSEDDREDGMSEKDEAILEARQSFHQIYSKTSNHVTGVLNRINQTEIHFIQNSSNKSGTILKPNDNNSGLLNAIKFLDEEEVFDKENHLTFSFIKKWLGHEEGFDLATNVRIKSFENEVFTVELLDGEWQYLGDLGLGAQQLFELIISIAKIIHQYDKDSTIYKPMLLIEEPESHIHPALQSKLADFFYQVNLEYDLRFIVETHSEYLIRKTQLISLENGLLDNSIEKNPFNVIYFDKKNGPYTMNYTKDGRFDRNFGDGFYDVSTKILRTILKKSKTSK
ncbi:hypothetical protein CW751_14495 [Brumimicrobium salinarum]|uniref:Endonuclease GajA/Old nuclease/RecF-like AAA domain-containing protein n=1 Tax=Brumimicrobium salinarum TaxID=2058658 RepID=A0A2I0QYZ8_9FLAO|nr:AAA family ATPase [Brumimicrobium salinarum]PKR79556.1 hypothetical protein CW751_14495 [Brumimicrobium salinarum]